MGLLDRALKNAINSAVSNAVGTAVQQSVKKTIQPTVNKAVNNAANAAAQKIESDSREAASSLSEAGAALNEADRAASAVTDAQWKQALNVLEGMANSAAKSTKVCPSCGTPAKAEQKFCPSCGAKLPDFTLAEGAVCPSCGKQNEIGARFCDGCGAKLTSTLAAEEAQRENDAAVLAKWHELLPQYPVWCFGGSEYELEPSSDDDGSVKIFARFSAGHTDAAAALDKYCSLLAENGFKDPYGSGGTPETLYRVIDGECICFNRTDAVTDDGFCVTFYSDSSLLKPKTEPQKKSGGLLGSLFG